MCSRPTVSSLAAGFRCAAQGILDCVRRERNFRIHLSAACCACALGVWMELDGTQWGILLLTQALVLSLELMNTAVEAAVDLICPARHLLAKRAKDAAAGAVLAAAAFSVLIGVRLFWNKRLFQLAAWILTAPAAFAALAAAAAFLLWFVFGFGTKKEQNREERVTDICSGGDHKSE